MSSARHGDWSVSLEDWYGKLATERRAPWVTFTIRSQQPKDQVEEEDPSYDLANQHPCENGSLYPPPSRIAAVVSTEGSRSWTI